LRHDETDVNAGTLNVLALNSGSSSLKFGLYRVAATATDMLMSGAAGSIGSPASTFEAQDARHSGLVSESMAIPTQRDAIIRIGRLLAERNMPAPDAIGHRIVHGGPKLLKHCLIDTAVLQQLSAAVAFAPLHTPPALSVIRYALEHFPQLPHAACFDTSFHAELPQVARVLPIARNWQLEGVRRYGFHGLSCESIVHQLGTNMPQRLVIAHLGNGSSITAVKDGRSVDTSMGLTPTGGVIMGTRSGDLDPGVLLYLLRAKNFDATMLEELVDRHSGLLGISGIDSDMRQLHEAAPSNADAALAIEMFCYSVRKQLAAMIAVLDGVDLMVFTGGIGEHDPQAREAICRGLSWIGVSLNAARNRGADNPISNAASRCVIRVLPSQEDETIARHTRNLFSHAMPAALKPSGF
jgi:acetate kinase